MRWICLLTAAGCLSQGPRADAPAGCVEVTPEQLSFETKLLQVAIREVTVTNTCPGTLEIESIFFDAGAPHFSAAAPEQHIVARGASQTFMVNFVPQALGRVSDTLHVRTSDLDNPDVAVPIEATVSGPHLVTSQAALDFTDATLGCTATLPLVLRSVGTDSLESLLGRAKVADAVVEHGDPRSAGR